MPSPARRPPPDAQMLARLAARLEALEDRVRRLERQLQVAARAAPKPKAQRGTRAVAKGPAGLRCPGCTLELPPGQRAETCVWCGFHFAVKPPTRPARKPASRR